MLKTIAIFAYFLQTALAIDLHKYEEGYGIMPPLAEINVTWMYSVHSWNFLTGSKYAFFRLEKSFNVKNQEEIGENDFENVCIQTKITEDGIIWLRAFGIQVEYGMSLGKNPAVINWRINDAPNDVDRTKGVAFITLTDNKTYFLTIQYWDLVRKSWVLMSTENSMTPELQAQIMEHIQQFGFSKDSTFYKDFNTCK